MRKPIVGAKYFIKDKVLNIIIEAQIMKFDIDELVYKNLETGQEFYREIQEIDLGATISEEEALRLNNQEVFSVSTPLIRAIVGRNDIMVHSLTNFTKLNKEDTTVLISITDPGNALLPNTILNQFQDSLSIQFWDIEEEICQYKPIKEEEAKTIKDFINKHKDKSFIIHCEAGISRSAAVGMAVILGCECNWDKYLFSTSPNPITNHHRYHPNWTVFDMIASV